MAETLSLNDALASSRPLWNSPVTIDATVDIGQLEGEALLRHVLDLSMQEPSKWGQYANRINNLIDVLVAGKYDQALSIVRKTEPGMIPFPTDISDYASRHFGGLTTDTELIRGRMDMDRFAIRTALNRELQAAGLKSGIVLTLTKYLRRDPPAYDGAYFTARDGGLTSPLVDGVAKLYFGSMPKQDNEVQK